MKLAIAEKLAKEGTVMCDGSSCDGKNEAQPMHTCPYKEINDDESLCNCCDQCTQECRWAI